MGLLELSKTNNFCGCVFLIYIENMGIVYERGEYVKLQSAGVCLMVVWTLRVFGCVSYTTVRFYMAIALLFPCLAFLYPSMSYV